MNHPMMKCGHAANAQDDKGNPSCVICVGIHPGARIVDDNPPDLAGRIARCAYWQHGGCRSESPSAATLAFFEHLPNEPYDRFYCGCRGWD